MESIKAAIRGDGIDSSVEFSVEEVMARHTTGKPWGELSGGEQEQALKDYALALLSRQNGVATEGRGLQVTLQGGSFSKVGDKDV